MGGFFIFHFLLIFFAVSESTQGVNNKEGLMNQTRNSIFCRNSSTDQFIIEVYVLEWRVSCGEGTSGSSFVF
jgi:hypothetical protein